MQLAMLCTVCLLPSSLALPLPREAGGMSELQWKQAQVCHGPTHLGLHGLTISFGSVLFNFGNFSDYKGNMYLNQVTM